MGERTLVDYCLGGMKRLWRCPVKHADPYTAGVPDLSGFVPQVGTVWIECKALDKWPARASTPVRLSRYTDDQKYFLTQRNGFLFVRVGREYILICGKSELTLAGTLPREDLIRCAVGYWKGSVDWEQFTATLRQRSYTE